MASTDKILEELFKARLRYKGVPINILGLPTLSGFSKSSLITSLHRLKKKGFVNKSEHGWIIMPKGIDQMRVPRQSFNFEFSKDAPKNLLLMFDIPHARRGDRDWLRSELRKFDYVMIQRSVWVGPSPLPKDFLKYLKEIKLKDCIRMFKLAKGINGNN